jgi:hypothetical protein
MAPIMQIFSDADSANVTLISSSSGPLALELQWGVASLTQRRLGKVATKVCFENMLISTNQHFINRYAALEKENVLDLLLTQAQQIY